MTIFDGVMIGKFTLHSGSESPVKFDVMRMMTTYDDRKYVLNLLRANQTGGRNVQAIVGIETGGAVLAAAYQEDLRSAEVRDILLGFVLKDGSITLPKNDGVPIRTLLIDDVRSTGSSLNEAQTKLAEHGYPVISTTWVIDRHL